MMWHNIYLQGVIKNYGECCWVWSNGKAEIFNTGSDVSNLSNSVWQVSTCSVQSVSCELRLRPFLQFDTFPYLSERDVKEPVGAWFKELSRHITAGNYEP
jgi:hypothetical protein